MKKFFKKKIIKLYIHSYENLYGNYYMPGNAHLDSNLLKHISLLASDTKLTEKVEIHIWGKEESDDEKFTTALTNSLTDLIKDVNKEMRGNTVVAIISLFIGILVGLISSRLSVANEQVSSVVLIAFWVFIWYSVETYIFDNFRLKLQVRRYQQIMNATIKFQQLKEKPIGTSK